MIVFTTLWGWIKRLGRWIRDNPIALAGVIGAAIGGFLMWKRYKGKVATLEDAVAIQATKRKIAKHETRAKMLEASADAREPEATALKKQIAESKRRVVEIQHGPAATASMNDEQIAKLFTDSGL